MTLARPHLVLLLLCLVLTPPFSAAAPSEPVPPVVTPIDPPTAAALLTCGAGLVRPGAVPSTPATLVGGRYERRPAEVYRFRQAFETNMLANLSPLRDYQNPDAGFYAGAVAAARQHQVQGPNYWYHWRRDAGVAMTAVGWLEATATSAADKLRYLNLTIKWIELEYAHKNGLSDYGGPGRLPSGVHPNQQAAKLTLEGLPLSTINEGWSAQDDSMAYVLKALVYFGEGFWNHWSTTFGRDGGVSTRLQRTHLFDREPIYKETSLIKVIAESVAAVWRNHTTEAWEEVDGIHFATLAVEQAALMETTTFIENTLLNTGEAGWYEKQANEIETFLEKFWDPVREVIVPSLEVNPAQKHAQTDKDKNGLDIQTMIGICHGKSKRFSPASPYAMSTAYHLEMAARQLSLNHGQRAILMMRYLNDKYNGDARGEAYYRGGYVWILATYYMAEHAYKAASELLEHGTLNVGKLDLAMYNYILEQTGHTERLTLGQKLDKGQALFQTVLDALIKRGDMIIDEVNRYATSDGLLSEQIKSDVPPLAPGQSGAFLQRSAESLTWSYAVYFRALKARHVFMDLFDGLSAGPTMPGTGETRRPRDG